MRISKIIFCMMFVVLSEHAFSIRFLDFSEYDFGAGKKGLRLVDFDVEDQKFKRIHYYQYPAATGKTIKHEGFEIKLNNKKKEGETKISCADAAKAETFVVSFLAEFKKDLPPVFVEEKGLRTGYKIFWKNRGNAVCKF